MAGFPNLDYIINANNFQKIQDCLSEASDMAMLTVDYQGNPVTRHSRCSEYCLMVRSIGPLSDLCRKCDSRGGLEAARLGKPYLYVCHRGLLDFAVPIIVEGHYTGAVLAGQVVVKDEGAPLEKIVGADNLPLEEDQRKSLEKLRALLPVMTRDRIQVIANMTFQITNYIIEEALVKMNLNEAWEASLAHASTHVPASVPASTSGGVPCSGMPVPAPARNTLILQPALDYIRDHYEKRISLDDMASLCNISASYFSKLFKRITGDNFANYINQVRIDRACALLATTDTAITAIAFDLGFEDNSYFDKVFKRLTGVTPSFYKAVKQPQK